MFTTKYSRLFIVLLCVTVIAVMSASCAYLSWNERVSNPLYDYTVVIDAGHGGIDGGVCGKTSGINESDLNLEYAYALKQRLDTLGFKTVMTRTDKGGLYGLATKGFKRRDMNVRKDIISSAQADLVVSVHMNRYSSASRYGAQVFFQSGDELSANFANCIQKSLNILTGLKLSALKGDFFICKCAPVPSVIVECGFLSNPDEEMLLQTAQYQEKIVDCIVEGVMLCLYSGKVVD